MHHFTVHNLTWRALPAKYSHWNSVWKRFWQLSRSRVFEAFFQLLAETSETAHLVQMFDSTVVRAHVSAAGAKGGSKTRRSRGGFMSKIHLKADFDGLPIAFHLSGGEVSDSTQLTTSLDIGPDIKPRAAMTDKGYDSKTNRVTCCKRGIVPVIPYRSNAEAACFLPKDALQGPRPRRAVYGQAQALQACGAPLREYRGKLYSIRCIRLHHDLGQIRPQGLELSGPDRDLSMPLQRDDPGCYE